jgi:hypothetical protein
MQGRRGQDERVLHTRSTRRAWQVDGFEPAAQSLVSRCVHAHVGEGALRVLEKGIVLLLQGLAFGIERGLRGRYRLGRRLHVGRIPRQGLAVDVGEAHVGESRRDRCITVWIGAGIASVMELNILSVSIKAKNFYSVVWGTGGGSGSLGRQHRPSLLSAR